jgi:hypothetical protein
MSRCGRSSASSIAASSRGPRAFAQATYRHALFGLVLGQFA